MIRKRVQDFFERHPLLTRYPRELQKQLKELLNRNEISQPVTEPVEYTLGNISIHFLEPYGFERLCKSVVKKAERKIKQHKRKTGMTKEDVPGVLSILDLEPYAKYPPGVTAYLRDMILRRSALNSIYAMKERKQTHFSPAELTRLCHYVDEISVGFLMDEMQLNRLRIEDRYGSRIPPKEALPLFYEADARSKLVSPKGYEGVATQKNQPRTHTLFPQDPRTYRVEPPTTPPVYTGNISPQSIQGPVPPKDPQHES